MHHSFSFSGALPLRQAASRAVPPSNKRDELILSLFVNNNSLACNLRNARMPGRALVNVMMAGSVMDQNCRVPDKKNNKIQANNKTIT